MSNFDYTTVPVIADGLAKAQARHRQLVHHDLPAVQASYDAAVDGNTNGCYRNQGIWYPPGRSEWFVARELAALTLVTDDIVNILAQIAALGG